MLDIIGVGDSDVDFFIEVDHIPAHDEKVKGKLLGKFPGGIIGNFCCACAKLGMKTGIATVIGNDDFSSFCIEDYKKFGVDIGGLMKKDGDTYFCLILLDATREKSLTLVETPLLVPNLEDLDFGYITKCHYLHLSSLSFDLAKNVCEKLSNTKIKVSIDIESHSDNLSLEKWEKVVKECYIVFSNEQGIQTLFGDNRIYNSARYLAKLGPEIIVITKGEKGVDVFAHHNFYSFPAFKVNVADTQARAIVFCFNATRSYLV